MSSGLDAFLSTWSSALATFGQGTPVTGGRFDQSRHLYELHDDLGSANPDRSWSGSAASRYASVNADHQRVIGAVGSLDQRLAKQIDQSAQIVRSGRQDLDEARHWVLKAAALVPSTPVGERLLAPVVSAGLSRVTDVVTRANNDLHVVAANILTIKNEYQTLGDGPRFGGHGTGDVQPLDVPQAPPQPPPYPINDVIAEATDLDGNHVVLRRGYYDATTQRGFGWDKAYWRHHVVNPNVFTDLISHSRPVSNDNGTLVYEVPINRVHCSQGFLGLPDCQDTGESVTMRIVTNVNEGRPDIPDGGQKGVISMYPLAGGSGVVELQPGWTLTPPWVNNNVPIN